MKRLILLFAMLILAMCLVACGALGVPAPETFNQRVAAAITTVTAIRNSASVLKDQKRISGADAVNVQRQADAAMSGISVARSLAATDMASGDAKLAASISMLSAVQAYLASREGAPIFAPPAFAPASAPVPAASAPVSTPALQGVTK